MDGRQVVQPTTWQRTECLTKEWPACEYGRRCDHRMAAFQRKARKIDRTRQAPPRHEPMMVQALRRTRLIEQAICGMTVRAGESPEQVPYDTRPALFPSFSHFFSRCHINP